MEQAVGATSGVSVDNAHSNCPCELFAAVTERAALASGRWLGRGDVKAAEDSASAAMRDALDELSIEGHIVVGAEEAESPLAMGTKVGRGGRVYDLAADPLEGRSVVARGEAGAMAMIAVGDEGKFPRLPDMYMRKMAVGPVARGRIDLASRSGTTSARSRRLSDGTRTTSRRSSSTVRVTTT